MFRRKQKTFPEKAVHWLTHSLRDVPSLTEGVSRAADRVTSRTALGVATAAGAVTVASGVISALRSKGS